MQRSDKCSGVALNRYESGCPDVAVLRQDKDFGPHVKSFSYMNEATPQNTIAILFDIKSGYIKSG